MTNENSKPTATLAGAYWEEFFNRFGHEGVPDDFMLEDDRRQGTQSRDPFAGLDHDAWLRDQVARGLAGADDLAAGWPSNEDAKAAWAALRSQLKPRRGEGEQE